MTSLQKLEGITTVLLKIAKSRHFNTFSWNVRIFQLAVSKLGIPYDEQLRQSKSKNDKPSHKFCPIDYWYHCCVSYNSYKCLSRKLIWQALNSIIHSFSLPMLCNLVYNGILIAATRSLNKSL